jgi:DNA modification methylase
MSFEIKQGDVLQTLRQMDAGSVQCVITSPPYYGLRLYGTEPQVWGNHNGCSHVWGEALKYAKEDKRTPEQKASQGATVGNSVNSIGFAVGNSGNFCLSCNAWRGELGLEPTFQLYISHLIEIFAEVKRVLKKDGTCFVNLGDSYAGSWGNYGGQNRGNGTQRPIVNGSQSVNKAYNGLEKWRPPTSGKLSVRPKSLMNIPARFAIAMTDDLQMIQRNELIWHKPACMPSSATDRWTVDFEPIYFFAKSPKYKFNQQREPMAASSVERLLQPNYEQQIGSDRANGGAKTNGNMKAVGRINRTAENGNGSGELGNDVRFGDAVDGYRNARTVMRIPFEPQSDEHYASYPTKLVEPMILAGTDEGDTVMDIFAGTGTTLLTALRHRRNAIGIELQPKYVEIARKRLAEVQVNLF